MGMTEAEWEAPPVASCDEELTILKEKIARVEVVCADLETKARAGSVLSGGIRYALDQVTYALDGGL